VDTAPGEYWNHNVHYQRVILEAVPQRCGAAVDIGCGDGLLACRLAARCAVVTGIDRDEKMIAAARERARSVPAVSVKPVGERLYVPGAAERVGDVADAGLLRQHLLGCAATGRGRSRRSSFATIADQSPAKCGSQ